MDELHVCCKTAIDNIMIRDKRIRALESALRGLVNASDHKADCNRNPDDYTWGDWVCSCGFAEARARALALLGDTCQPTE